MSVHPNPNDPIYKDGPSRCEACNAELSYCGTQTADGPRLDCRQCQLRDKIGELREALRSERAKVERLEAEVKRLGLEMNTEYWYAVRDENTKLRAEVKRLREAQPKADAAGYLLNLTLRFDEGTTYIPRQCWDTFVAWCCGKPPEWERAPAGERKEDGNA